jgi:hypothetical protein
MVFVNKLIIAGNHRGDVACYGLNPAMVDIAISDNNISPLTLCHNDKLTS